MSFKPVSLNSISLMASSCLPKTCAKSRCVQGFPSALSLVWRKCRMTCPGRGNPSGPTSNAGSPCPLHDGWAAHMLLHPFAEVSPCQWLELVYANTALLAREADG